MSSVQLLQQAQYVVDVDGNRKAIVLDVAVWEELLTLLEDLEDAQEIQQLRESGAEAIPWAQAKQELRDGGVDV